MDARELCISNSVSFILLGQTKNSRFVHKLSIELDKIVKVHEKNVSEIVKDLYEVTSEFLASGEVKGTIDLHNY